MKKHRILQSSTTGKYKIQVRYLFFFWSTLQKSLNGTFDMMSDAWFDSYEEALKECKKYTKSDVKEKWYEIEPEEPWDK